MTAHCVICGAQHSSQGTLCAACVQRVRQGSFHDSTDAEHLRLTLQARQMRQDGERKDFEQKRDKAIQDFLGG